MARNLLEIQDVALEVAVSGMGGGGRSTSRRTPVGFHLARGPKVLAIVANPDVNLASPLSVPRSCGALFTRSLKNGSSSRFRALPRSGNLRRFPNQIPTWLE